MGRATIAHANASATIMRKIFSAGRWEIKPHGQNSGSTDRAARPV
jgi:hypothetical protein